jgi:hypothetical protein
VRQLIEEAKARSEKDETEAASQEHDGEPGEE